MTEYEEDLTFNIRSTCCKHAEEQELNKERACAYDTKLGSIEMLLVLMARLLRRHPPQSAVVVEDVEAIKRDLAKLKQQTMVCQQVAVWILRSLLICTQTYSHGWPYCHRKKVSI